MLGLSSIDFSSLCGLGDIDRPSAATVLFNMAVAAAPEKFKALLQAFGKSTFNAFVDAIYDGGYVMVESSDPRKSFTSSTLAPLLEAKNKTFSVFNFKKQLSPEELTGLYTGLDSLSGYKFVLASDSGASTAPASAPTPYQGAMPSRISLFKAPVATTQSSAPEQETVVNRIRLRSKKEIQELKNRKQKMLWYLGAAAMVFAISAGLVAAKSGE